MLKSIPKSHATKFEPYYYEFTGLKCDIGTLGRCCSACCFNARPLLTINTLSPFQICISIPQRQMSQPRKMIFQVQESDGLIDSCKKFCFIQYLVKIIRDIKPWGLLNKRHARLDRKASFIIWDWLIPKPLNFFW